MIRSWITSLAGRLTLILLGVILLAQALSLALYVDFRIDQEARTDDREFFRELSGLVDISIASADTESTKYLESTNYLARFGGRGVNYWTSSRPATVRGNPPPDELLPLEARRMIDGVARPVSVRLFPDPRSFMQKYFPFTPPEQFIPNGSLLQMPPPPRPGPPNGNFADAPRPPRDFERRPPPPRGPGGRPPRPNADGPPPVRAQANASAQWTNGEDWEPDLPAARMTRWLVSIQLPTGEWLNAERQYHLGGPPWFAGMIYQTGITAVTMVVFVLVAVGFATRPLAAIAEKADRLGRGEDIEPIKAAGASEIQRVVTAFNTMNERLKRFIANRTKMLGAISHDLRTPITAMRIRAELIEDNENRERMLEILAEMQSLAESSLALAKEDSISEPTRAVNLSALTESVCDDLSDIGLDVGCNVQSGVTMPCRPNSLKRAIRNLAENAVKYGKRARIVMTADAKKVGISVLDDGPGIPEDQLERVFQPFVRLEESRNRETGGVGLGLAIARSVAQSHGGDLVLKNRAEGGLCAMMELPRV
ncbi:MAG: hypothetical protein KDE14_01470 [Rhodobacteraceae bacterium]|nr:hypothetical protein [Paracoccaceae bacterium]